MTNLIPGAERSQIYLDGHPEGNISRFAWPTYRRLTSASGGDVQAEFTFTADDSTLEEWFYNYLGREVIEAYDGKRVFMGRVHTMRLAYNRMVLTISLDWLYNHVACQYTSVLDSSTLMTGFEGDTSSQAQWGIRSYIIRPSDEIGLSEAETEAEKVLADFKQPRVSRGQLARQLKKGTLKVTVQGYSQTLDAQFHNEIIEGTDDADVEVGNALSGASFITAGRIEANATQVSIQADYRRKLQRIEAISGKRDSLGRRYVFGAFAGKQFDYYPVNTPTTTTDYAYNLSVKQPYVLYFSGSSYVPAPLVTPGGWSRITDMSRPPSQSWNPLNQFDEVVEYNQHGALLKGGAWSVRERIEAIQMSLIAQRS